MIEIQRNAQKAPKKIPDPNKYNLIESIDSPAENPQPDGCTKFKAYPDSGTSTLIPTGLLIKSKTINSGY